jgi:hypothetical protein
VNLWGPRNVLCVMRRITLLLACVLLAASACDSGEADRLREQLDAARSQLAAEEEAAQVSEEMAQDSERDRRTVSRQLSELQEQLGETETRGRGVVVAIPLVGRLSWRCNDAREFSFTFMPEQATVTVEQSIEGEITREQLDPGEELTSSFDPPDVHREWTVTYRHEPATISAGISVLPGVDGGACFIRNSTLEQNNSPH